MLFGIWTHGSARSYACGWGSWILPWEEGHFWGVILGHAYICLLSVFSPLFTEISSNASTGYKYCSNLFKMSGLRSLSLTNCIKCWMRQYLAAQWAHHSLRLRHDSVFVRLPAINWQFCHIDGSHMVVGHSLSPVCRRGTHCRNVYMTLPTAFLFLAVFSKHYSFQSTNVEILARMHYVNPRFTLHYIPLYCVQMVPRCPWAPRGRGIVGSAAGGQLLGASEWKQQARLLSLTEVSICSCSCLFLCTCD